jgi:hypothetical protein
LDFCFGFRVILTFIGILEVGLMGFLDWKLMDFKRFGVVLGFLLFGFSANI